VTAPRYSLAGKLALVAGADAAAVACICALAAAFGLGAWAVLLAGLVAGVPLATWSLSRALRPVRDTLRAVTDGVRSFHENDFGLRIAVTRHDELGDLVDLYNRMGDVLRLERNEIFQRELLLDTLLMGAPMAIVLLNELDRVAYANRAARVLLAAGERVLGRAFSEVLEGTPAPMRSALQAREDSVFAVPRAQGPDEEIYRVVLHAFVLNTQRHRLVVVERITPELRRQEVETWKNAIRVMSHELNNSLAPVSSLLHSARAVAGDPARAPRLEEILSAIEERVKHLNRFLEGYGRFARLPKPRPEVVKWRELLDGVARLYAFTLDGEPPERGTFDPAQMQQVLINLLKNAVEAGSPPEEIRVKVEETEDATLVHVLDRGKGMDEETMRKALLPFYSSKETGTGLGLPLCSEIVAAHGGRLSLRSRAGGGLIVTCVLPAG
jgi:two-component system nitrogen regulation sensor histidine kinase NtrY